MNTRQFQTNELTLILNEHFQWSKPPMACFVGMLAAIVSTDTVNLTQLALLFTSRALISSRYRRIQRFFHHHRLDYNEVAGFVIKLFGFMTHQLGLYLVLNIATSQNIANVDNE